MPRRAHSGLQPSLSFSLWCLLLSALRIQSCFSPCRDSTSPSASSTHRPGTGTSLSWPRCYKCAIEALPFQADNGDLLKGGGGSGGGDCYRPDPDSFGGEGGEQGPPAFVMISRGPSGPCEDRHRWVYVLERVKVFKLFVSPAPVFRSSIHRFVRIKCSWLILWEDSPPPPVMLVLVECKAYPFIRNSFLKQRAPKILSQGDYLAQM